MARTVPAVHRALDILELFAGAEELSVPDMVSRLELPRTSVHELVRTLVARSYLTPSATQAHRYRLGTALQHLGALYSERLDLTTEGQAVARSLVDECRETVHVAVLDGREVVYVAKVDSTHPVRMVSAVGRRLPAHCTAVGTMLLAHLPPAQFDELFASEVELTAMTERSVVSPMALRRRLSEVAARGLAYEYCESNDAVACVAAPVRDEHGTVTAAMSISVPTIRWSDVRAEGLGQLVTAGAAELSARLGYRTHR